MCKKVLVILLVSSLLVMSFVGCKKDTSKNTSAPTSSTGPKSSNSPSTTKNVNTSTTGAATASPSTDSGVVTDYSIDLDFQIKSQVAGVVFGYIDTASFLMWQVDAWDFGDNPEKEIPQADWKVYFRPHIWNAGAVTVIEEMDISNAIKWEDRAKKQHMKIVVNAANEITTYINDILIHTYTDPMAAYGLFGFRESANVVDEQAYFDNIVIKNTAKNNAILYQEDFNKNENPFAEGEIVNGAMGDSPALLMAALTGSANECVLN